MVDSEQPAGPPNEWPRERPIPGSGPPPPSPLPKPPRRGVWMLAQAVACVGIIVIALSWLTGDDDADEPPRALPPTTIAPAATTAPAALPPDGDGPSALPTEQWAISIGDAPDQVEVIDVAADDERVYAVVQLPTEEAATALAFDADDGTELWRRELWYPRAYTPAVVPLDDDDVLLLGEDTGANAELVDAASGDSQWLVAGTPSLGYTAIDTELGTVDITTADTLLFDLDEDFAPIGTSAVARATGEVLWETDDQFVLPCGDVAISGTDEPYVDAPTASAHDLRTGEELWTRDGEVDGCSATVATTGVSATRIDLIDVGTGDAAGGVDLPSVDGDLVVARPVGDLVVATAWDGPAGRARPHTVVIDRARGEPVWDEIGAAPFALAEDRVLLRHGDGRGAVVSLVRPSAGEDVGRVRSTATADCRAIVTATSLLGCEYLSPEITSASVGDRLAERWRLDVGAPVHAIAVGGDRLFVGQAGGRLVAYA